MELIPLDDDSLIELGARWLSEKRNRKWLDLGGGEKPIGAMALRIMTKNDAHIIRAFTADDDGGPIGLVALSSVNRDFRAAVLWALLGDRRYAGKGYLYRSTSAMLTLGFDVHGLECVNAWALESNQASLRILKKLNFRPIGRQRHGRDGEGEPFDRLLFELQAGEHRSPDVHPRITAA
ncbi:MAG TPA: GNAT family protein [Gammaproteobacteria bacterium]|nr:GNAT family protein [Gammaproteobacteria bacterium]